MNKKLAEQSLLLGLLIIALFVVQAVALPQEGKKNTLTAKIVLEIANPLSTKIEPTEANAFLGKQLNFFLKAAATMEEKNREKPFILFGNQVKGKIARWLTSASELETQD